MEDWIESDKVGTATMFIRSDYYQLMYRTVIVHVQQSSHISQRKQEILDEDI